MKLPELADLISRVDVESASKETLERFALVLAAKLAEATGQLALRPEVTPAGNAEPVHEDGAWLTVKEAAEKYPLSCRWFYRKASVLPFIRRVSSKKLLVHEPRLRRWLERTG